LLFFAAYSIPTFDLTTTVLGWEVSLLLSCHYS
jgi:hypothetical protein